MAPQRHLPPCGGGRRPKAAGRGVSDERQRLPTPPSPTLPLKGGGSRPSSRQYCPFILSARAPTQFDQRGKKSRQRLAGAGRRNEKHRTASARLRQQFELVRARFPAALREPARKRLGQHDCFRSFEDGHALEVMPEGGRVEAGFAATTTRPGTGMLFSRRDEAAARLTTVNPASASAARTWSSPCA